MADSIYLSKELYVGNDNSGFLTDSILSEFYFDSLKRVIRIVNRDLMLSHVETRFFYYQGISQKPYKDSLDLIYESTTTYYTYNADKLIADSIITRTGVSIDIISLGKYTNSNNKVYVKSEYRIISSQTNYSRFYADTITYDGVGNIVAERRYSGPQNDSIMRVATYTYNTKNSPYKMLNIKELKGVFVLDTDFNPITNDFNTVNITYPNGGQSSNDIWSSIYNAKNYPTKSIETYNNSDIVNRSYTYIAL